MKGLTTVYLDDHNISFTSVATFRDVSCADKVMGDVVAINEACLVSTEAREIELFCL